jgi:hypothetical protein
MARVSVRHSVLHIRSGQLTALPSPATSPLIKSKAAPNAAQPTTTATATAHSKTAEHDKADADSVHVLQRSGEAIGSILWAGAVSLCQFLCAAHGMCAFFLCGGLTHVNGFFFRSEKGWALGGRRVLELGAGVGTCGIYVAQKFADVQVITTDREPLLPLLRQVCIRAGNGLKGARVACPHLCECVQNLAANANFFASHSTCEAAELSWGDATCAKRWGTFDLIIASDVVYKYE